MKATFEVYGLGSWGVNSPLSAHSTLPNAKRAITMRLRQAGINAPGRVVGFEVRHLGRVVWIWTGIPNRP